MNKFTFWLFALFLFSWQMQAQVVLNQNFDAGTTLPAGWTQTGGKTIAAAESCAGNSIRDNLYSSSTTGTLVSPNQVAASNGTDLTFSFDYKIENWNTTTATPPGWGNFTVDYSTNDGANWTTFFTVNDANHITANTCATFTNTIPGASLPAGSDVKFRFNITWVAGDWDVYFDNIAANQVVSSVPNCATNMVSTPNATCGNFATSLSWNAVTGVLGYYLTVGTTTGGTDILNAVNIGTVTTYSLATQTANTNYYWTLVPFNSVGPAINCTENTYITAANGCYCTSVPTSNDGSGITNVQLGTTDFPNGDVMYFDHTATTVDLGQGVNANVQVTFATGFTYDTNIWIDFNDDYNFDATEQVFDGASLVDNPTTLNASFTMPAGAPLGVHRMRIGTADTGQATPNPCYSGSWGVTLDFSVNIVAPSCTPPAFDTAVVSPDCDNNQYFVNVDVTALGSGTPSISDGTNTWAVAATGLIQVGPFASGSSVSLNLLHGSDAICDLTIGSFTYTCPPANDACADAVALTVGAVFADNAVTGTNVGATDSAETAPGCASYAGGDVWYTVTVPASGSITVETNPVTGSTITDSGLAVYSGACGALTLIECDDDDSATGLFSLISLSGLTPADVLYVNVWEYGNNAFGEFQVSAYDCPSATPAPTGDANQTICDSGTLADLDVTGTSIIWYDAQTGGNVLADTTALVDGVTYYASQTINCESFARLAVTVAISTSPVVTNFTLEQCDDDTDGFVSFDLTSADGSISSETGVTFTYYTTATDANAETNAITSPYTNTSANQIVYVRVENAEGCFSVAELTLTVNAASVAPTGDANQNFCSQTLADLVVSGTNLIWYDAETGGNVLPGTTTLVDGTTYYVSQTTNGCESIDRLAITVAEDCPCLTSVNGQWPTNPYTPPVCDGATVNTVTTCGYASEYSVVNVVAGETYTFASSVATDVITISTDMGATASAFGTGSVTWVSTVTGAIYFYTHTPGCGAASVCRTKTVVCGTPPTTAPDCPTLTAPADMATDLNTTVPISWTAPTTGSSVSSYNVYLGTSTPPTTLLGNVTATSANITGLTPSTTYYWMVTSVNAAGESTGCSIYSFTTVAAPANDACADAIALTTGGVFADNAVTGTNLGATNSAETAPGCASYGGGDVWYTVTVPASGSITVETNPVTGSAVTDTGLAVYSGACGSLTLIECDDDDSASGLFSLVSLTGLTPGDVLYVNVWEYGNNAFGEFQVSAYDASLSTATFDNNSFMLYPNPVRDVLNLSYSSNITSVRVANMLGQMVINKNINANQTQLDMSHLQSGAYIVTVVMDNIEKVVKVIKQ